MSLFTRRQDGQLLPLVAFMVFVAAVFMVVLLNVGVGAGLRAQAQTAADAAALAGAAEDRAAAVSAARANGADLVSFRRVGTDVEVEVRIDDEITARARARLSHGDVETAPALRAAVARAEQFLGRPLTIVAKQGVSVTVAEEDARRLRDSASDTGLCWSEGRTFIVCPG